MLLSALGHFTELKDVHFSNAYDSILVTLSDSVIFSSDEQFSNAWLPITVTVSGRTISFSIFISLNAFDLIAVTGPVIVTLHPTLFDLSQIFERLPFTVPSSFMDVPGNGMLSSVRDGHTKKAARPILVTVFGIETVSSAGQFENANSPIVSTPSGRAMLFRSLHAVNA